LMRIRRIFARELEMPWPFRPSSGAVDRVDRHPANIGYRIVVPAYLRRRLRIGVRKPDADGPEFARTHRRTTAPLGKLFGIRRPPRSPRGGDGTGHSRAGFHGARHGTYYNPNRGGFQGLTALLASRADSWQVVVRYGRNASGARFLAQSQLQNSFKVFHCLIHPLVGYLVRPYMRVDDLDKAIFHVAFHGRACHGLCVFPPLLSPRSKKVTVFRHGLQSGLTRFSANLRRRPESSVSLALSYLGSRDVTNSPLLFAGRKLCRFLLPGIGSTCVRLAPSASSYKLQNLLIGKVKFRRQSLLHECDALFTEFTCKLQESFRQGFLFPL